MTQTKTAKKADIKSSTCNSGARLLCGVVLLTVGIVFLLSLFYSDGGNALDFFSSALEGLGGQLCALMPPLMLIFGAALCVSAYQKVSFRPLLVVLALYLCALALLFFTTFIETKQMALMAYIQDFNTVHYMEMRVSDPSAFGSYLKFAYMYGAQYAGGGLGMLLAYPLYRALGNTPAMIVLCLGLAALFFLLLRLNPLTLFAQGRQSAEQKREARRQQELARRAEEEQIRRQREINRKTRVNDVAINPLNPGQSVVHVQTEETPAGHASGAPAVGEPPYAEQAYDEPSYEQPSYNEPPYCPPVYQPSDDSLYPDPPPTPVKPAPAKPAPIYEKPMPVKPANVYDKPMPAKPASVYDAPAREKARPAEERLPWEGESAFDEPAQDDAPSAGRQTTARRQPAAPQPVAPKPVAPQPVAPKPIAPPPAIPVRAGLRRPSDNASAPESAPAAPPLPKQDAQDKPDVTVRARGRTHDVGVAPAVPLTGERIPLTNARPSGGEPSPDRNIDGTARVRERQMTIDFDGLYTPPPISLLNAPSAAAMEVTEEDMRNAQVLEHTLASFRVEANVCQIVHGPAVTRFALQISEGIKIQTVIGLSDTISLKMAVAKGGIRIAALPGTTLVGVEMPRQSVTPVLLREVLDSPEMRAATSKLSVALGKDISGKPIICDLDAMPHLLIAGATGSGKSVCINSIITSLIYRASPEDVRLIMVDPKVVELQIYNGIPHLLVPVVSAPRKAASVLNWATIEMNDRYDRFALKPGVRNIYGYNKSLEPGEKKIPYIVIVIDELADLMMSCKKEVEASIRALSAKARASGIYLVVATQRPSVDVITGIIKSNITSRISFAVVSAVDSRIIIDSVGAEKLVGKGDMLYMPMSGESARVQGCYVSDEEVQRVTNAVRSNSECKYDPAIMDQLERSGEETTGSGKGRGESDEGDTEDDGQDDEYMEQAIQMAVESGEMSISMLRRCLKLGHSRAGRIVDEMARRGIITPYDGSKSRKTLLSSKDYQEGNY